MEDTFKPLLHRLKNARVLFRSTIVYCQSYNMCADIFKCLVWSVVTCYCHSSFGYRLPRCTRDHTCWDSRTLNPISKKLAEMGGMENLPWRFYSIKARVYHPCETSIKEYVENENQCRKDLLLHFMENYTHSQVGTIQYLCCDVCALVCTLYLLLKKLSSFVFVG